MAIEKNVWIGKIIEGLTPAASFLSESEDLSEYVEYNTIDLTAAGVDPDVLIDNADYPIEAAQRTDTKIELPLHTFDTENTVVRSVEAMESAADKMESVIRGHRRALVKKTSAYAAYNWCPLKESAETPVLETSGEAGKDGLKRLTFEDVLDMEARFRNMDVDPSELVAVLNINHLNDLRSQDIKHYKEILADNRIFGFKLYTFTGLPYFSTATKNKLAFGAATTPGTDTQASLFYVRSAVMRATGTVDMFLTEKSPKERGDVVGFQQRFTALPYQNKYIGAIYSGKPAASGGGGD